MSSLTAKLRNVLGTIINPATEDTLTAYIGESALTPDLIADLALWLKADAITGLVNNDPVASWLDASVNARHAVQADPAKQPLYITNVIDGKPVVRFDGVDDSLSPASAAFTHGTAFVVGKRSTSRQPFAESGNGSSRRALVATSNGGNQYQTFELNYYNGAPVAFGGGAINAVGIFSGIAPYAPSARQSLRVGLGTPSNDYLNGDIAELIIFTRSLTPQERVAVERYLSAKYGIAYVNPNNLAKEQTLSMVNVALGAPIDGPAASDTSVSSLISLFKRALQTFTVISGKLPASIGQKNTSGSLSVTLSSEQGAVLGSTGNIAGAATLYGQSLQQTVELDQINAKLPATLGQKSSALSLATVLSAEQEALLTNVSTLYTGQVLAPGAITNLTATGYSWIAIRGSFTSGTAGKLVLQNVAAVTAEPPVVYVGGNLYRSNDGFRRAVMEYVSGDGGSFYVPGTAGAESVILFPNISPTSFRLKNLGAANFNFSVVGFRLPPTFVSALDGNSPAATLLDMKPTGNGEKMLRLEAHGANGQFSYNVRVLSDFAVDAASHEVLRQRRIGPSSSLAATYSRSGTTVTATTPSAHNFETGDLAYHTGATDTGLNGYAKVTVTGTTTYTFTTAAVGAATGAITVKTMGDEFRYRSGVALTALESGW